MYDGTNGTNFSFTVPNLLPRIDVKTNKDGFLETLVRLKLIMEINRAFFYQTKAC